MSKTDAVIRILHPSLRQREMHTVFAENAGYPRSRLYGLAPREGGTVWGESLTSYLNRLGCRHGISPRWLVAQEILPYLSNKGALTDESKLAAFSRINAMSLNGMGQSSVEWASRLERLTARSDLRYLTLLWWIGIIPSPYGLLRQKMAWCPCCYEEWKEKGESVYQPLLWALHVVNMCVRHNCWLVEMCPICKQQQSVIARETLLGYCTQCNIWLGTSLSDTSEQVQDKEMVKWQQWIVNALQELLQMSTASGILSWKSFFANLSDHEIFHSLFQLSGMRSIVRWQAILEFSYLCELTPFQIMMNYLPPSKASVEDLVFPPTLPRARTKQRVDVEACRNLLQAVLQGDEEFLTVPQIARRLNCHISSLIQHFPQECALIAKQGKAFRKKRREQHEAQLCEEVRRVVFSLHSQGIFPTTTLVVKMLSQPGFIRRSTVINAFHAARRELGLE